MDFKHSRRSFLRHSLLLAASTTLAGCSAQTAPKSPPQKIEFDRANWTHPYHDAANTNHSPTSNTPAFSVLSKQWQINQIASSAVVSIDGALYTVFKKHSDEALCALNQATGAVQWTFTPSVKQATNTQIEVPTVTKTTVYASVQFRHQGKRKNFVYAIDRQEGTLEWRTEIVAGALIRLHHSGVAIATKQAPNTFLIHAMDANTGDILWELPENGQSFSASDQQTGRQQSIRSTAIVGNNLYIPITRGDETEIQVVDIVSGDRQKQFTVPASVEFTLVAANGLLYSTTHSLIPGTTVPSGVYAIDPEQERLAWTTKTTEDVYWLGVSNSVVYFVDGGVRSVDAKTGKELWKVNSEQVFPAILGNTVPSFDPATNRIQLRKQRTGTSVTTLSLQKKGYINFVSSDENSVYIIKGQTLYRFS
ncbi:outer membrane protein assembly factor BamB family protein [Haladaptatus halobius]|uniref:outer membrane protein assembly factor BamB family protein n=1 Tax=Haladaptatus halobius TaxID=2884875 RepID=UPI001D0AC57B|nr:PQQ-binding-like beta-propeller repeat protein [Haladaptatus halobius]